MKISGRILAYVRFFLYLCTLKTNNDGYMENIVKIASYIVERYHREFDEPISEMKLHKLLYFAQRECIIQTGEPMFANCFVAWKYGPVMVSIRGLFALGALNDSLTDVEITPYQSVMDFVFKQYASKDAWGLSRLSHGELSWQNARKGLAADENGSVEMKIVDIYQDAKRAKNRRFLIDTFNQMKI